MNQHRADAVLVLIAVIWGTTFTIVNQTVDAFPALALIALRFALAGIVFVPALVGQRGSITLHTLRVGVGLGVLLFAGFATQTYGLQYTTPARGGFITGLNVVLVPLLGLLLGQRAPRRAVWGVLVAVAGLIVLSWGCNVPWLGCTAAAANAPQQRLGDALVLLCAVAFAAHIVAVGRWATTLPVLAINAIQLLTVAVLATLATLATLGTLPVPTLPVFGAALFLGLVASALVFGLQLKMQQFTTPTHTALIFALEPVFAALFSWLWTGEALTGAIWLGGALMLLGIVVAEVGLPRPRRRVTTALEAQQ